MRRQVAKQGLSADRWKSWRCSGRAVTPQAFSRRRVW